MDVQATLEFLRGYCRSMPPVAAMQIDIGQYVAERLSLTAPLAANLNDKGCAFGGSLASLLTLSGWALVTLRLRELGMQAEVFVADSRVKYLAPVYTDLVAVAGFAPGEDFATFARTLAARGRARIEVMAEVALPDGAVATTLGGRFVALAKR